MKQHNAPLTPSRINIKKKRNLLHWRAHRDKNPEKGRCRQFTYEISSKNRTRCLAIFVVWPRRRSGQRSLTYRHVAMFAFQREFEFLLSFWFVVSSGEAKYTPNASEHSHLACEQHRDTAEWHVNLGRLVHPKLVNTAARRAAVCIVDKASLLGTRCFRIMRSVF